MSVDTIQKQDIEIKRLTSEEILAIYTSHAIRHFPKDERKPVSSIRRMAAEGIYIGYGLYMRQDPGCLLGYAFFTLLPDKGGCLLDYFAVMEDYRSCGIGSLFLQYIKASFLDIPGFLIESEDPDYAGNSSEYAIRCKRLAFYERNGAVFTGLRASVFGVPYRLLFFPLQHMEQFLPKAAPSAEMVSSHFCHVYQRMVSPEDYASQVHLSFPVYAPDTPEKGASR